MYLNPQKTGLALRYISSKKRLSSGNGILKYRVIPVAIAKRHATMPLEFRSRSIMPPPFRPHTQTARGEIGCPVAGRSADSARTGIPCH